MLTRSSAAMKAANNTLEETIALESAAVQITRNAETTGTAFRTISMRIRGYDEETEELSEDLENISGDIYDLTKVDGKGISIFTDDTRTEYKSTYDILEEIAGVWDELTDKQQADLLEKLGGKRGAQTIAGILDDFSEVERAMDNMENAAGSADAEMGVIEDSIEYKLNALKQTWVQVLQDITDRGIIGDAIDFLTNVSDGIGTVISNLGLLGTAITSVAAVWGSKHFGIFDTQNPNTVIGAISAKSQAAQYQSFLNYFNGNDANLALDADVTKWGAKSQTVIDNLVRIQKATKEAGGTGEDMLVEVNKLLGETSEKGGVLSSTFKNIGVSIVNGLASAAISAAVSWLIGKISEVADELIITQKEAEKLSRTFRESFEGLNETQTDTIKTINEIEDEFTTLSKGVSALGTNIGLTDEEFERYHEITSIIADNIPNLVQGYDEQGNAIIRLRDNVSSLSEAYEEEQKRAALELYEKKEDNDSVIKATYEHANDVVNNAINEGSYFVQGEYGAEYYEVSITELLDTYEKLSKTSYDTINEAMENDNGIYRLVEKYSLTAATNAEEYNDLLSTALEDYSRLKTELTNSAKDIREAGITYAQAYEEFGYYTLTSDQKKYFNAIMNSLDYDFMYDNNLFDQDAMETYVRNLISNIGDESFTDVETLGLEIKTKWDNDELTYDELLQKLSEFNNELAKLFPDNLEYQAAIRVVLGIPTVEEIQEQKASAGVKLGQARNEIGVSEKSYAQYVMDISDTNQQVASEWYDSLSASEREFIDDLSSEDFAEAVTFTSTEQFDEWLAKLQEEAGNTSIELNVVFSTDVVEELDKLSDTFEGGLDDVYDEVLGDDAEALFASAENLQSVIDDFGGTTFDFADDALADANTLSNAIEQYTDSFTELDTINSKLEEMSEGGTVNLTLRPEIDTSELESAGWEDVGDGIATVYSSTFSNEEGTQWINFTPIIVDPETGEYLGVLTEEELTKYAEGVIAGTQDDYYNLQIGTAFNTLEEADAAAEEIHNLHEQKSAIDDYQEATNKLATAYIDQSGIIQKLTEDNYDYYISVLEAEGVTNAEEVVLTRLGVAAKTTSTNLVTLSTKIAQYKSVLENASENDDWENAGDAVNALIEPTQNLLDVNGTLSEVLTDEDWSEFIKNNFETIEAAVEGDIDALKQLRIEIAKTKYTSISDEVWTDFSDLQTAIDNLSTEQLEALSLGNISIEDTELINYLNILWQNISDGTEASEAKFEELVSTITGGTITVDAETYGNGQYNIITTANWNGSSTGATVNYSGVDDDSDSDDDDDDDETDISYSEESWDWIETAIDRLESQIDRLDQEVENTYDNWSKRNGALAEEIDAITQEIEMQSDAADKYYEEAEEINLPDDYKLKVQNGEMDVETINESNITDAIIDYYNDLLAQGIGDAEDIEAYNNGELQNSDYVDMLSDSISDYTDLYEKSMDAADEVVSLTLEKQGLFQQYFDNLKDEYEDFIDIIDAKVDWIEERIDRTEEHGYFVDESYYQDLLANEKDNYATLMAERDELIEAMNTAVSTGGIEKGSSAWNEMYEDILSVNQAIEESLTNTVKLNNEIRQLNWDKFDYLEERLSDINDEAEFFIKLLSGEEMYDDYGMFNSRGWANAAMVASKYNDTLMKAKRYEEELLEVEQELADDPYNKDLIERKEELVQTYRDAIEAAEDEKAAMKSLVEEGINKNLSALQDLIDEYKEAIQSARDLYSWQTDVADQTKNIANLQKQLAAYEGDDSEETRKRRQELQNQLEDAEESLEESQWDHYITETNDMLSELYDSYEETLNSRLDNIDLLMQDMIGEINSAKTDVSDGLNEVANMYGYSTTNFQDFMSGSYSDDLVSKFENGEFSTAVDSLTAIENSVSGITDKILAAQDTYYNGVIDAITEGNDYTLQVNDDGTITKISGSSGTSGSGNSAPTSSGSGAGNSDGGGTWQQDGQKWWYQYSDGSYAQNGFKNIDDKQYYFDENGYMISDQFVQGKWLDHNGEASGEYQWKEDGSDWTYENNDGNTIKNAWAAIDGEWYYFDENGHMVTGKYSIAGKSYSFGTNGKWLGYYKGTKNVPSNQLAFTQENGQELIFSSASGAILTPLGKGDKVFTAEMTDRLWDFAQGNLPDNINKMEKPNIVSSNMNNIMANNAINIELPNVTNYDEFKSALKNDGEMEKFWQEITIGKAMGNNSLKKHSI